MTTREVRVPTTSLAPKDDFIGLGNVAHLAAGGETPFLRRHEGMYRWFAEHKSGAMKGREVIVDYVDEVRARVARRFGLAAEDIGFSYNVAQASNMIVRTLSSNTLPGNVVMTRWEYPSMMYPWLRLRDAGWDVRLLSNDGSTTDYEALTDIVDGNTVAIVVSHVSYLTGERVDLQRLRAVADTVGAVLIVDASHSLGVVETDWSVTDFMVCCCYKWLLGCHGVSVAYRNRARQPTWKPLEVGWTSVDWQDSAQRGLPLAQRLDGRMFELGNVGWLAACILGSALDYVEQFDPSRIESHVLALSGYLRDGLAEGGIRLMTPSAASARAGNVAFRVGDEEGWRRGLEGANVLGWTSDSRVRFSTHLYNDVSDVDRAITTVVALADAIGQWTPAARPRQSPR